MARASPIAKAAVVEEVGTKPQGHASSLTLVLMTILPREANVELALPVKTIIFRLKCLRSGSN